MSPEMTSMVFDVLHSVEHAGYNFRNQDENRKI
jgi:hypothetical protein